MKISQLFGRVFLVSIVCFAFITGFAQIDKAFGAGETCSGVPITDCSSCSTNCSWNLDGDSKVTTSDLIVLQKCLKGLGSCTGSVSFDVNGDGSITPLDLTVLYKCFGCTQTPSPFK